MIYILDQSRPIMWWRKCRRWGHRWNGTSIVQGNDRLFRCAGCLKEKWGERDHGEPLGEFWGW